MTTSRSEAARPGRQPPTVVPDRDCPLCPRLVAFREANRAREPLWHNAPVAPFGDIKARLLIVGLAPGMQGANRTGRPFTGDYAGDLLYATLLEYGGEPHGLFATAPQKLNGDLLAFLGGTDMGERRRQLEEEIYAAGGPFIGATP